MLQQFVGAASANEGTAAAYVGTSAADAFVRGCSGDAAVYVGALVMQLFMWVLLQLR
jgi:hypothetical protein